MLLLVVVVVVVVVAVVVVVVVVVVVAVAAVVVIVAIVVIVVIDKFLSVASAYQPGLLRRDRLPKVTLTKGEQRSHGFMKMTN